MATEVSVHGVTKTKKLLRNFVMCKHLIKLKHRKQNTLRGIKHKVHLYFKVQGLASYFCLSLLISQRYQLIKSLSPRLKAITRHDVNTNGSSRSSATLWSAIQTIRKLINSQLKVTMTSIHVGISFSFICDKHTEITLLSMLFTHVRRISVPFLVVLSLLHECTTCDVYLQTPTFFEHTK